MPRWDDNDSDFSPLMRLRRSKGFNREQACVLLGCSLSAMIRYERGRVPVPFLLQKKMRDVYDVSVSQLFEVLEATYAGRGHTYYDENADVIEVEI